MLAELDPRLVITDQAKDLFACEVGALALFFVRAVDLFSLNINRPIIAHKKLRVVLWIDAALDERVKFESPDFYDWTSHFVKCPPGVPAFAVEGLRVGSRWWPGVAWTGAGLELALAEVGVETMQLDPDSVGLVETLARDRNAAIRWVGVDSIRKLWRMQWAMAKAQHHGFCVLDQPSVRVSGWFPVDSRMLGLEDARGLMHEADDWLVRAIEAEFEREALELLTAGVSELELDDSVVREIGLLLRPGPRLRRLHGSQQVADWRRELVQAIRREPGRQWSCDEIALLASLEREGMWLANIAIALAGDPWQAREQLEPTPSTASTYAAIQTLCGDYSQAIQQLAPIVEADSLQTRLYLALLHATGRSAEAEAERTRLFGAAATDTPPSPEILARELLLTRLRDF